VIVGFPGETEEEFEKSKAFVDKVNFYETHIFKYSKRQGTKAAVMEGQVPEQIKTVRSNIMLEMDEKKRAEYEKAFVGREVEVLFEEKITKNDACYWVGHTKEYVKIALQTEENLQNQLTNVRIDNQSQIIR
jgi:threonylcarbamoyladenosine tRNA methylthiotransferase MtaB